MTSPQPQPSPPSNQQVVENLYQSLMAGRLEDILASCTEDTYWVNPYPPERVPAGGEFRGREGVRRFFTGMLGILQIQGFELRQYVAQGDTVVVLGWERTTGTATGRTAENHFAHVYTLRDGKIASVRMYGDTATILGILHPQG